MKWFFVLFVSALVLQAQDPQGGGSSGAPAAQTSPAAGAARPLTIPAGAVWDSKGYYRYTDAQGKKWIYRKTPFGVTRMEDTPERSTAKAAAANGAGIKATEDGDIVRFERLGPFGLWKWEKKKSELDETEKAALENSQANNQTVSKQD